MIKKILSYLRNPIVIIAVVILLFILFSNTLEIGSIFSPNSPSASGGGG